MDTGYGGHREGWGPGFKSTKLCACQKHWFLFVTKLYLSQFFFSFYQKKFVYLSKKKKGPLGSCFLKLFLRTIFENTKNIISVFSENCSCSLNLMFSMFSRFFKKKKNKGNQHREGVGRIKSNNESYIVSMA